jgi:molecular chaperone GrpE (heat shock protein)
MKKNSYQLTTYARSILSDLPKLASLILKYSDRSNKRKPISGIGSLLTQSQIDRALENPQNSMVLAMNAQAFNLTMKHELMHARTQAEAQRRLINESLEKIKKREEKAIDQSQKEHLEGLKEELNELLKNIRSNIGGISTLEKTIDPLTQTIENICSKQDQDWEQFRSKILEKLATKLEMAGVTLNEFEQKDLRNQETWTELLNRFKNSNLEVPKSIHIEKPNNLTYFQLKGFLAVHSAMARQMQLIKTEDILKILKPIIRS